MLPPLLPSPRRVSDSQAPSWPSPPGQAGRTRGSTSYAPHHEPMGGYSCSHVTDRETEAPRLNNPGSGRPSQALKPGVPAAFSPHPRACWPEPLPTKEQSGSWAQSSGKRMKRKGPNYWGPRLRSCWAGPGNSSNHYSITSYLKKILMCHLLHASYSRSKQLTDITYFNCIL